jgi:hypothetical protein
MAMSKKIGTTILSALMLWGFEVATPSLALADPPSHAPAYGYRAKKNKQYKYIYYPSSQIYYSPASRRYYYPYSGGWRYGVTAPTGIVLGNGVSIQLGGPTPYVYHPTVIQQYPVVVVP